MAYKKNRSGTKLDLLTKIKTSGGISKAELSKELNLSKPAVTENVNQLLDSGLVIETGEGEASRVGGRKPMMLEIRKNHRYIIGIDLGTVHPVCAIGNLAYELLHETTLLTPDDLKEEERLDQIKMAIDLLLEKQGADRQEIGCIVISTPGVVGKDDKIRFVNKQHEKWTSIKLKEYLKKEYRVHVSLKNDVNMALMAEMELGHGQKVKNLAYIRCGLGVGSGIALDRKLYEGENFAAGEIGFFIDASGNGAILEELVSVKGILARVIRDMEDNVETGLEQEKEIEFQHIAEAYDKNNSYVKRVFYETGKLLGAAAANMVSLLDIGMVIFGGIYIQFWEDLYKGIDEIISKVQLIHPKLEVSGYGSKSSIYGCFVRGTEYVMKVYSKE